MSMDPLTLQALRESIEHWRRLATQGFTKEEYPDSEQCSLCKEFAWPLGNPDSACKDCPVYHKTQRVGCFNTPYYKASNIYRNIFFGFTKHTMKDFKKAAAEELAFLESLLPKDNKETTTNEI